MEESSRERLVAVSAVAAALLVLLNVVLAVLLLVRSGSVEGAVMGTRIVADELAALKREVQSLKKRVEAPGTAPSEAGAEEAPPGAGGGPAGAAAAGKAMAFTFDGDLAGFRVPRWATGSLKYTNEVGWYGRRPGALMLGYVYGPANVSAPAAAAVRVSFDREPEVVRVGMRARAADALVAIGVEEKGGALYEKRVVLRVTDGWVAHKAALREMQPVEGAADADGVLSWPDAASLYVADRSPKTEGGNVLVLDDVAVEFAGD